MLRYLTKKKKAERHEANHKAVSRMSVLHENGRAFGDSRGKDGDPVVTYDVRRDGSFRALTKPRSRVKRLREQRNGQRNGATQ